MRLSHLYESVLDWKRPGLAPAVWSDEGGRHRIRTEVKVQIMSFIDTLPPGMVQDIWVIGSITGFNYNDRTDIDVHVIPTGSVSEQEYDEFADVFAEQIDFVEDHPIQYYLHRPDEYPTYADGIYDLGRDRWLKWQTTKKVNVRDYYDQFRQVVDNIDLDRSELRRDIIDYKELQDALPRAMDQEDVEAEIEMKLMEINDGISGLIGEYEAAKQRRSDSLHGFDDEFDVDEVGTVDRYRSDVPDNVIYKLLERYHYKRFLRALKSHRKLHGEVDSEAEADHAMRVLDFVEQE